MIQFFKNLLSGRNHTKRVAEILPTVALINEAFDALAGLSDDDLRAKTGEFKARVAEVIATFGPTDPDAGETADERTKRLKEERVILQAALDEILPEAFAVVKEGARRLCGQTWSVADVPVGWEMVHFDCQLVGGVVLHQGKVAEMATGEGKTLVATLPTYLNALAGRGLHIVTVNDYLARRDAEWMGHLHEFLGLTVGCVQTGMTPEQRRGEYAKDITYGTNNEFGFDYLRDNMCLRPADMVQRGHHYAIVDEVDSVLIDEARTPLIISGQVQSNLSQRYREMAIPVDSLVRKQLRLVNEYLTDGEALVGEGAKDISADARYSAGQKLLAVSRGAPKNKKFLKLKKEPGIAKLIQEVENDYIRDKKMHQLDETLYFVVNEREHGATLTDNGELQFPKEVQDLFIIPDLAETLSSMAADDSLSPEERHKKTEELYALHAERSEKTHAIQQLLKGYMLYEKDVEYVLQDGKILIVDEFTGRLMPGRRYSDGLHQAIEAKEGVRIEAESQTLATITLQNYFRMYSKLAGMTGTAETEADEFMNIYGLDVVCIPTNKATDRTDLEDEIYRTRREKYNAILKEIEEVNATGRPILVGTVSVDVSETLSRMLQRQKITHNVLNAKQHQREAEIVMDAGKESAVTIATNMAGRGTDIKLGPGIREKGGLHIIGTERHEARRIDRQLRGRSGRQGDPGSSKFFLSLEDDLMRLFGGDRLGVLMDKLGIEEGEVIKAKMVTKAIERAQKKVEAQNFATRKHTLEYDDVMNVQRRWIYQRRSAALTMASIKDEAAELCNDVLHTLTDNHCPEKEPAHAWDVEGLKTELRTIYLLSLDMSDEELDGLDREEFREKLQSAIKHIYSQKEEALGGDIMRELEKFAVLTTIDRFWRDHLAEMDELKSGIGLRGYHQGLGKPIDIYKKEGFAMFEKMVESIDKEAVGLMFRLQPSQPQQQRREVATQVTATHAEATNLGYSTAAAQAGQTAAPSAAGSTAARQVAQVNPETGKAKTFVKDKARDVGPNDPCWCGSGKKFKKCHGE